MRKLLTIVAAAFFVAGTAWAQEGAIGAGRIEIGAFPGGGIFFGKDVSNDTPNFGNYALATSLSVNLNKWIGIEGELTYGVGIHQDMWFKGLPLTNQKSPDMVGYNGNLVVHPAGSDRSVVPFVVGGVGGLTLLSDSSVTGLGVTQNETYFSTNVGGGVKWFATRHIGLKGDARFIFVKNKTEAPFFGQMDHQYGGRFYGGLVLTY